MTERAPSTVIAIMIAGPAPESGFRTVLPARPSG